MTRSPRRFVLVAAVLVSGFALPACDSVSGLTGGSSDALSTLGASSANDLLAQLMGVVNQQVGAQNLTLSDNLTGMVTEFVRGGVDRLISNPSATGVATAKTNLNGFVGDLLGQADVKQGVADMSSSQFDGLTASVCPLPPFCD